MIITEQRDAGQTSATHETLITAQLTGIDSPCRLCWSCSLLVKQGSTHKIGRDPLRREGVGGRGLDGKACADARGILHRQLATYRHVWLALTSFYNCWIYQPVLAVLIVGKADIPVPARSSALLPRAVHWAPGHIVSRASLSTAQILESYQSPARKLSRGWLATGVGQHRGVVGSSRW